MSEIDYSKNVGKVFRGKVGTSQRDADYKVLSFLPRYGVEENKRPAYRFAKVVGNGHGQHLILSCEDFHAHLQVVPDGHLQKVTIPVDPLFPSSLPAGGPTELLPASRGMADTIANIETIMGSTAEEPAAHAEPAASTNPVAETMPDAKGETA